MPSNSSESCPLPEPVPLKEKLAHAYTHGFPEAADPSSELYLCLRHSLTNPGGMVRAELAYRLSIAYGLPETAALQLATGIEYFQTASLLFDDLPSMDNSPERRNKPTPHVLFGESKTILTALALINKAYKLLWNTASLADDDAQQHALHCIDQCLGMRGLVGGQSDDLHKVPYSGQDALKVANKKTRPLLRLAMELPATIGGADPRIIQLMRRLSIYWGLVYQLSDDFKDLLADHQETGKPTMQDAELGRPNYVLLEGHVPAIAQLKHYVELARKIIHQFPRFHPSYQILQELQQWFEHVATKWSAKVASHKPLS